MMQSRGLAEGLRTGVAAGALTVAIVVSIFGLQIGAPFELQDDHRIVTGAERAASAGGGLAGFLDACVLWWDTVVREDPSEVGRFRPVSQIGDVVVVSILGRDPLMWRLVLLAVAGLTTGLLFRLGLLAYSSRAAAMVFSLGVMLAPSPGPAAAWYRLGPKEWIGLLFLSGGLLLLRRRSERPRLTRLAGLVLCALGGMTKESFAITLPAVAVAIVAFEAKDTGVKWGDALRRRAGSVLVLSTSTVVNVGLVGFALWSAGSTSYGARGIGDGVGKILASMREDALLVPGLSIWLIPAVIGSSLALARRDEPAARRLLATWICAVALCVPQSLLHAPRGGMWDHYWIPCIVGLAALNAAGIAVAMTRSLRRSRWTISFVGAVCAVWVVNAIRVDVTSVLNFRALAEGQQAAVFAMAKAASNEGAIVVAGEWQTEAERAWAVAAFLQGVYGRRESVLFFDTAQSRVVARARRTVPAARWWTIGRDLSEPTPFDEAEVVLCLGPGTTEAMKRLLLGPDDVAWSARVIPVRRRHLSLRRLALVSEIEEITLLCRRRADVPRPERSA